MLIAVGRIDRIVVGNVVADAQRHRLRGCRCRCGAAVVGRRKRMSPRVGGGDRDDRRRILHAGNLCEQKWVE